MLLPKGIWESKFYMILQASHLHALDGFRAYDRLGKRVTHCFSNNIGQRFSDMLIYIQILVALICGKHSRYIDQHTPEVWILLTYLRNIDQRIPATLTHSRHTLRMLINIPGVR